MAIIIVLAGMVQPAFKSIVLLAVAFRPMSLADRDRALSMQEATSKMSITPFYVEAILLEAFAYTFAVQQANLVAKIHIVVFNGLLVFFIAQLVSATLINVLRVLHRDRAGRDEARALALVQHRREGEDLPRGPSSAFAASPLHRGGASGDGGASGTGGGAASTAPLLGPNGRVASVGAVEAGLERDMARRQWRRDLRRALIIVPVAILCLFSFFQVGFR